MVKELKVGNYYYFKGIIPSSPSVIPPTDTWWSNSGGTTKYRVNGGTWQTRTGTFYFEYSSGQNKYEYYDGSYHDLTAGDTFEFYSLLGSMAQRNENTEFFWQYIMQNVIANPIEIELDTLNCEPHVVSKTAGTNLLYVDTAYGVFREEQNMLTPSIVIEYDSFPNFNYVYIPSLSRYYFVMGITLVRYRIYRVDLKVDVLCTYDSDIRLQSGFIARNENAYNPDIVDNRYPMMDVPIIDYDTTIGSSGGTSLVNVVWNYDSDNPPSTPNAFIALSVVNDLPITYGTQDAVKPSLTELPSVNRSIGDNPLTMTYALTYQEWGYVTGTLKSQSSLASYVTGAVAYPFKLNSDCLVDTDNVITTWPLKINNLRITDDSSQDVSSYAVKGESSCYWIIADFTPQLDSNYTGSLVFLNYEPYTKYQLYIPFKGWVDLPSREIVNFRIIVYYATDYTTGDGAVYVYNYDLDKMIYSSPVQIGIKMGSSLTNIEEITKQKQTNVANLMLGLIGSATSVVVGAVSENPVAIVAGLLSGTKSIASAVNVNRMLIEKASCTISGDKLGLYGGYKPILKKISYAKVAITESVYAHTQGYPNNDYDTLANYTGYTEIPEMHYTPSTYKFITKTEIDEIVSLAKNGIIL